eukprot:tig00020703_g13128.t1
MDARSLPPVDLRSSRVVTYDPQGLPTEHASLPALCDAIARRSPDMPAWIDVEGPHEEDLQWLQALFCLHPLTTKACLALDAAADSVSRMGNYVSLVVMMVDESLRAGETALVACVMVVFPDLLATFHARPAPALAAAAKRARAGGRCGGDWAAHAAMDAITDALYAHVQCIVRLVEGMESEVLELEAAPAPAPPRAPPPAPHRAEGRQRAGASGSAATHPRPEAAGAAAVGGGGGGAAGGQAPEAGDELFRGRHMRAYLTDIEDHVVTAVQQAETAREVLASVQATHSARAMLEMARAQTKSDEIVKNLSMVMAVLLPPSLLPALFGMNVPVPMESNPATGAAQGEIVLFWWQWGAMAAFVALALAALKLARLL